MVEEKLQDEENESKEKENAKETNFAKKLKCAQVQLSLVFIEFEQQWRLHHGGRPTVPWARRKGKISHSSCHSRHGSRHG